MGESVTVRKKRLLYQSRYRGRLEADILFGRFADVHLGGLDETGLDRYEALLHESDQDLFAWIMGMAPVPPEHDHELFALLQNFRPAEL
jgi:antitoxin CptB